MLHITEEQYRFLVNSFHQEAKRHGGDLWDWVNGMYEPCCFQIDGNGLISNLTVTGWEDEELEIWHLEKKFLRLQTFNEGRDEVPNDFDKDYFIELYKQAA